jgi:hypothetical protein
VSGGRRAIDEPGVRRRDPRRFDLGQTAQISFGRTIEIAGAGQSGGYRPTMLVRLIALVLTAAAPAAAEPVLLVPARVFDGRDTHAGWAVLVDGERIAAAGPLASIAASAARRIDLPGATLLPGLIEGHSHLLLHPYDQTSWDDQVLRESEALRAVRATVHAAATLRAGFTTVRDLGSEGAGEADVALKTAASSRREATARKAPRRRCRKVPRKPTAKRWSRRRAVRSDAVPTS